MKGFKQTAVTLILFSIFFANGLVIASAAQQNTSGNSINQGTGGNSIQQNTGGGSVQQNTGGEGVLLENPLGNKNITQFLQDILNVIMVFAIPLIVFMIIYAGFLFVMDRGSDKQLAQAKRALLYAVIGGVIILGAQAILAVVQGTVDAFR